MTRCYAGQVGVTQIILQTIATIVIVIDLLLVVSRVMQARSTAGRSGDLAHISIIYPSPGSSSERMHLYWTELDAALRVEPGGGAVAEGEDTQAVVLPLQETVERVRSGEIHDAKTVIAPHHLDLFKLKGRA